MLIFQDIDSLTLLTWTQIVAFYRALLYSTMTTYVLVAFGSEVFGTTWGVILVVAGGVNILEFFATKVRREWERGREREGGRKWEWELCDDESYWMWFWWNFVGRFKFTISSLLFSLPFSLSLSQYVLQVLDGHFFFVNVILTFLSVLSLLFPLYLQLTGKSTNLVTQMEG